MESHWSYFFSLAHVLEKLAERKLISHKASSKTPDSFISTNTTPKIIVSSCPRTLKIYYIFLEGTIKQMENKLANVKKVDELVH